MLEKEERKAKRARRKSFKLSEKLIKDERRADIKVKREVSRRRWAEMTPEERKEFVCNVAETAGEIFEFFKDIYQGNVADLPGDLKDILDFEN